MPILGSRGAGSASAFGLTSGGSAPIDVDYLVVAGGGIATGGGGGGAGGYRTSFPGGTKITLEAGTSVPVTIGAGGALSGPPTTTPAAGAPYSGSPSNFSTITSSGGGGNLQNSPNGAPGGSGGGGYSGLPPSPAGSGNSGSFSPPEGNPGGVGAAYSGISCSEQGGGGGGAGGAGSNSPFPAPFGPGGNGGIGAGVPTDFVPASYGDSGPSPTTRYFAGGGGGIAQGSAPGGVAVGGYGGGGNGRRFGVNPPGCGTPGTPQIAAEAGQINTGGGAGGEDLNNTPPGGLAGGSGIVLINVPSGDASKAKFTVAPGTNTIVTNPDGSKTAVFTVSGSIQQG